MAVYRVIEGKVFKIDDRLYVALRTEHGAIRFIDVKGRKEVRIPPLKNKD